MNLASLVVKLSADASDFKKGFDDAQKQSKSFEAQIESLGGKLVKGLTFAAVGAAAVKFGKDLFDATAAAATHAQQMEHLGMRTGIAAQSLEEMSVMLARSGLSHEQLAVAMQQLSRNMIESKDGSGEAAKAFERLGVNLSNVGTNEDMLRRIADQFQAMPDGAEKTAIAMQIFGRAGAQMIPMLNQGAAGLEAAKKKAEEFGLVLTDTQRSTLSAFEDKMADLAEATKGLGTQIGVTMVGAFSKMVDKATSATSMVTQLIKAIRDGGPELDKFAEMFMEKTGGEFVQRGLKAPAKELPIGQIPQDVLDNLNMDKSFRTPEEVVSAKGSAAVKWTQRAALFSEKIGVGMDEALTLTRGMTEQQFQSVLAMKQQEQKFLPAIIAMQSDIQKGADLEAKNRNELFGAQMEANAQRIADEQELYGLGLSNLDVAEQMLALDAERTNERAKSLGMGNIQEGIGRAELASAIAARKASEAQDDMLQDQKVRLQRSIADRAALEYEANTSIFKSNQQVKDAKLALLKDEEDQRMMLLNRRVMGESERATEEWLIHQEFDNKRRQLDLQYADFATRAQQTIAQSFTFIWGNLVTTFSQSVATMILEGGKFSDFMQQASRMVLSTFISAAVNMTATWLLEQAKQLAAQVTTDSAKVASATAAHGSMAASGTAAATVITGAFTSAAAAVKGAVLTMSATFMKALSALWTMTKAVIQSIAAALKATGPFGLPWGIAITAALAAGSIAVMKASKEAGIAMAGLAAGTAAMTLLPFAKGGVVTGPTPALIGEAGPEAVIPLRNLDGMMGGGELHVPIYLNGREIAEAIVDDFISALRTRGIAFG